MESAPSFLFSASNQRKEDDDAKGTNKFKRKIDVKASVRAV